MSIHIQHHGRSLMRGILIFCASLLSTMVAFTPHGVTFTPPVAKASGLGPTATMTANDTQALFYPQTPKVPNAPSGIFSSDYVINQEITFTEDLSRLSTPVNPDNYRWRWDFGDGQVATGFQVKHQYTKAGTYRIHVDVTDPRNSLNNEPNFDSAEISILSKEFDKLPIAMAKASLKYVQTGHSITFNSAGSVAQIDSTVTYLWNFGDGTTDTTPSPTHTFIVPGQGYVALVVQDSRGARSTATVPVYVVVALPTAKLTADVSQILIGKSINFDASDSAPIDPAIKIGDVLVSYQWDFGDGETATTKVPTISHIYQQIGSYVVTLQAFDNFGIPGTAFTSVQAYDVSIQTIEIRNDNNNGLKFIVFLAIIAAAISRNAWWRRQQNRTALDRASQEHYINDKRKRQ